MENYKYHIKLSMADFSAASNIFLHINFLLHATLLHSVIKTWLADQICQQLNLFLLMTVCSVRLFLKK